MPYRHRSHGKWPMKQCNIYFFCLSLSSPIERWTRWGLHADQQATIITHEDSRTPLTKSDSPLSAVDHVWKGQAFSTIYLQLTDLRVFILPLRTKSKCYFIGWHSLWREGYIASVGQPQCVWGSNKMHTPSTVFAHNKITCAFLIHNFITDKLLKSF